MKCSRAVLNSEMATWLCAGIILCVAFWEPAVCRASPVDRLSPSQVVHVSDIVRQDVGLLVPDTPSGRLSLRDVSQGGGIWAALVPVSNTTAVVAVGTQRSAHAFMVPGDVRQIAVDQYGHTHLLHRYRHPATHRDISVLDSEGSLLDQYSIPASGASPLLTGSGLIWKLPHALVTKQAFVALLELDGSHDVNDTIAQRQFVGALPPGRGYFTFGDLSEMITLHREDGSVLSSFAAPLDAAYKEIGASVPKLPLSSERSRVIWASATQGGLLYVCLSGLPISGPAFIAVIEAKSGALQKVIGAQLPAFSKAATGTNPTGTMMPGMGAVDDQLVIADQQRGVIALY
jgi:hypothetical protein